MNDKRGALVELQDSQQTHPLNCKANFVTWRTNLVTRRCAAANPRR